MMPFFVRQKPISVKVGVHIVEAPDQKTVEAMSLGEENYEGYWTDDSRSSLSLNTPNYSQVSRPFKTKEEAADSDIGWVEDI